MKIAIGTKSPPKLEALKKAIKDCIYLDEKNIEIISEKVPSDISEQPLSLDETINGAKNRAENTKKLGIQADFYVGMEGGITLIGEHAYLFGSVYIIDRNGKSHLGLSPMMPVPDTIKTRVYQNGEELGYIMHELTGKDKTHKESGSFGMWSDEMITRIDQFSLAFLCAISPFYNQYYKK